MLGDLLEYNNYSKGTMTLFFCLMLVPPAVQFLGYFLQHDHVLVMIELALIGYALPMYVMHKTDEKIEGKLAAKDIGPDPKGKLKAALIQGSIIGLGVGVVLCIWAKFIPYAPSGITLQMPFFYSTWREYLYWGVFIFLWVLVLPIGEIGLYCMFQACVWRHALSDVLIAGCYAAMNFCWIIFVIDGWVAIFILTGISFGVGYGMIIHRDKLGGSETLGVRIGLAIGILALIIFLNIVYPEVKRPLFYWRGHGLNVWRSRS